MKWLRICDTNFTDTTARLVCESIGYADGKALCCSAYGTGYWTPVSEELPGGGGALRYRGGPHHSYVFRGRRGIF